MLAQNETFKVKVANYILPYVPLSLLCGRVRINPIIGYYHLVSDEDVACIKHLHPYKNVAQFKDDLDFISRKFVPLNLTDFLEHLKTGQALPDNAFLLTFDDGYRESYDIIAPILMEKGIPATFFISSAFVDNKTMSHNHKASLIIERLKTSKSSSLIKKTKEVLKMHGYQSTNCEKCILDIEYRHRIVLEEIAGSISIDYRDYLAEHKPFLTSGQIKEMVKKGFAIGAHSIDHPLYSALSLDQQLHQTNSSISFVREKFGLNYGAFAFPYNDYDISNDFFNAAHKTGLADVFFGTAGIMADRKNNRFQRFGLEWNNHPAEKIVPLQLARKIYKNNSARRLKPAGVSLNR
ncbi:MAG: polysaccharide deacetylase family protein [Smithella sp.]|jgi:peptidoglycan/xylan/chitin deacetylase (PgdA/CDA1 family)